MAIMISGVVKYQRGRSHTKYADIQQWMNGRAWRAKYGVDFRCKPENFRSSLAAIAKKHGKRVITARHGKNCIDFQFLPQK